MSGRREFSSPRPAPRTRIGSSRSPRWHCSTRTWPWSSSRKESRNTGCAAPPSAAASTARSWPPRSSTPSGPRPSSSGCSSSSTRRPPGRRPSSSAVYFDSLVFTPEALRHLVAETGPGQVVMGTDHPFPWTKTSVDHILATPGLTDAERAAMLGETAAKLLGIEPPRSRP